MTNSKKTKRALLSSVLALLLCFAMLLGTTFAWFTDTASTQVNKIEAGKLKVDIVDDNGDSLVGGTLNFKDVNESTDIKWEPGAKFKTGTFKIANKGNLALKYKLSVDAAGGDTKLMEVITFSVVDQNGNTVDLNNFEGNLLKETTSDAYYIKAEMKTNAGNVYQGLTLEGVAITVYATQYTSEFDSYGNQYDKDAELPANNAQSVNSLPTAASSGNIVLTDNVTGTATITENVNGGSAAGFVLTEGTLDGNGNAITVGSDYVGVLARSGTVKNVTLSAWRGIMIYKATGDIYVDNVKIEKCGYGINTGSGNDANTKLIVTNSAICSWNSWDNLQSASFTNCTFTKGSYWGSDITDQYLRPYVTSTFTNCDFVEGMHIDVSKLVSGASITFVNCTCNGVTLTADNIYEYLHIYLDLTDREPTSASDLAGIVNFA